MNRRSLIQSAAALLVPAATKIPRWGEADYPRYERAVEHYFETFTAYYGKPFRPDDNTYEAHDRADKDVADRKAAFESSRDELIGLVMKAHGLDPENDDAPLRALTLDVAGLTLVVAPHQDPADDCQSGPIGEETLALIPRTEPMRARLDALPTFNPDEWESDEEAARLGLPKKSDNYPEVDFSRFPAGEPAPLSVEFYKSLPDEEEGTIQVTRTWSPEGAIECQRCVGCPFSFYTSETIGSAHSGLGKFQCEVTVKDGDLDRVLYSPTPPLAESDHTNDLMVSTDWMVKNGHQPRISELIVTSRKDWEESGRAERDPGWYLVASERGTRGNLVVAIRERYGPLPVILEAQGLETSPA